MITDLKPFGPRVLVELPPDKLKNSGIIVPGGLSSGTGIVVDIGDDPYELDVFGNLSVGDLIHYIDVDTLVFKIEKYFVVKTEAIIAFKKLDMILNDIPVMRQ